ncbi:hypothetical protein [Amycolatopsis sp. NPDC051102]|uniref:hypothetical protein n=1 Tax=Amycolatopsis sp. NPDC051102 TaxID=3155163 RepID=UPI003441EACE
MALCSGLASTDVTARLAGSAGVELLAIDTTRLPDHLMPSLSTRRMLAESVFDLRTDTGMKRNFGLLLARLLGWECAVFLDDDIDIPAPGDLATAATLVAEHSIVGLLVDGFPDNSVVRHAYRAVGGEWPAFIGGGGALAVNPAKINTFFPNVYNEDLLFLLDHQGLRPAVVSGTALQARYDPFQVGSRARFEEFGDCVAEGVLLLHRDGRQAGDAGVDFWRGFLADRQRMIADTLAKAERRDRADQRKRMLAALLGAHEQSGVIEPRTCVEYLIALRDDRSAWHDHNERIRGRYGRLVSGVASVPGALGLTDCARYVTA